MLKALKLGLIVPFLLVCTTYLAESESDIDVDFFGNFGLVSSDSELLGYRADVSAPNAIFDNMSFGITSKLGIQLDYQISPDFDVVGQFLYRGEITENLNDLAQIAFIRYRLSDDWSVRLGRTPLDAFLLTEYRDIDAAIPWAKVPGEVYGLIPIRNVDGFDVTYTRNYEAFELRLKGYYGTADFIINDSDWTEDVIELKPLHGSSVELSSFNWLITFKYSHGNFEDAYRIGPGYESDIAQLAPIWPGAYDFFDALSLDDFTIDYYAFGGRYDAEHISYYAELTRISGSSSFVKEINSGYVSAVYHQGDFDYFLGYSKTHAPTKVLHPENELNIPPAYYPPGIHEAFRNMTASLNSVATHQNTVFAGFSWHINDNWSFKIQLDITDISAYGEALWRNPAPFVFLEHDEQVNTWFINLSFNF